MEEKENEFNINIGRVMNDFRALGKKEKGRKKIFDAVRRRRLLFPLLTKQTI
jgi:hypothetical protein